jgi:pantetheine-phosphate adenylyltransferase
MSIAVYAGSFDPVTHGHLDIIRRASQTFEKLVVVTTEQTGKQTLFSLEERLSMLSQTAADFANVEVRSFDSLLVDYARRIDASVIVRGLRAAGDFEYEFQMAMMNRSMAPDIETVFLVASSDYMFVSSSLVKQIAEAGGDVSLFVPDFVENAIINKLSG